MIIKVGDTNSLMCREPSLSQMLRHTWYKLYALSRHTHEQMRRERDKKQESDFSFSQIMTFKIYFTGKMYVGTFIPYNAC